MTSLVLLLTLVFLDSIVGFVSGFGTSTLLLPVLLLWYPIDTALILTSFVHLLNNISKAAFFFKQLSWHFFLLFAVPAVICSLIGAQFVFLVNRTLLARGIGLLLLVYILLQLLWHGTLVIKKSIWLAVGGGFYGLMEGLTGIGGAFRATLLSSYAMAPAAFVATNGAIALVVDIARLTTYTRLQTNPAFSFWTYGLVAIMTLGGSLVGKILVEYLPVRTIKRIVFWVIILASIKLIIAP